MLSALADGALGRAGARAVIITGEAGCGKSRLAQEFLVSLKQPWRARIVRVTRSGAALPTIPDSRPFALLIDDAQFLDPTAIEGLIARLDALADEPVLLILTFRLGLHRAGGGEMRALSALVRDPRAHEMPLEALSRAGIDRMASAMGREGTEELYRRTGGIPFWAEEVLRGGAGVPWIAVEAVTAQLDVLAPPARELACALAVAEEPVPPAAADGIVSDLDGAWSALRDAGLGRDDGTGLSLRHALMAEAIQASLGPSERAAWHRRLATALEREDVPKDRLAHHWDAAGDTMRAAAIAQSVVAELRAAGATRRAFECYRLAVRHPPSEAPAAAALHECAALTAARICEHDAMRAWLAIAERRYRETGRADRAVRMLLDPTFDYLPVGRSRSIRDEPTERLLVDAYSALGRADAVAARELIDTAVELARTRGDGVGLARAARLVLFGLGQFERGEALLDEASALPDVADHPSYSSRLLTIRACSRFAQGYPQEALDLMRRGAGLRSREPEALLWTGHLGLADVLLQTGNIAEGTKMLADAGRARGMNGLVDAAEAHLRFENGDVERGLDGLQRATDRILTELESDPVGRGVLASRRLKAALSEVHGNRPQAALATVRRIAALCPEPFNDVTADLAYVLARSGAALGDREAIRSGQRRLAVIQPVAPGPNVAATAEAVEAYAGRGPIYNRFVRAATLYERAPRAVLAAEMWCEAARTACSSDQRASALDRAHRLCAAHGLARVAAVADRIASTAKLGPEPIGELTARERDVVLLAAEGLSNRQIGARLYLAEGTVRNYLSTAFDKIGVSRRGELASRLTPLRFDHSERA